MSRYSLSRPIAYPDLNFINHLPDDSIIEIRNTKGQDKEVIKKIKSTIKIRIIGGLDEKAKPKYDTEKYFARTIYSPLEVYKIIEKMEIIEKGINPSWNDLEKSMYIYKILCESMKYDHVDRKVNGRDLGRNLLGFITGKAVCAGFAMMYKEMLDRQGIECLYQNKQYGHAWNLIKINGKYIPVDLTWDNTENEDKNNRCDFKYFGRDKDFFKDPNHIVTGEPVITTSLLTNEEFNKAYSKVISLENIEVNTKQYATPYGAIIDYLVIKDGRFNRCFISKGKELKTVIFDDTVKLNTILDYNLFTFAENKFLFTRDPNNKVKEEMHKINDSIKVFDRTDGSKFFLQVEGMQPNGAIKHKYIHIDKHVLNGYTLYSDDDLVNTPSALIPGVADILLSRRRVEEKANKFNGYVGYMGIEKGRFVKYANSNLEERISGIKRY